MTDFNRQEREAREAAVIGDGTCLETTPRDNFRNGFDAGYRAALAAREDTERPKMPPWRCPDCGSGITKIHASVEGLIPCGKPPGYWTDEDTERPRSCRACDGSGLDGEGASQIKCPECGGSGVRDTERPDAREWELT